MDYHAFISPLMCDDLAVSSQFQPSQFEHTFDDVEGEMNSRYNVSWMIGKECKEIVYGVVVRSCDGGEGGIDARVLLVDAV